MTIGELIGSIKKPISTYVDEIVKAFHEKLCNDLLPVRKCTNPADCNAKTDERKLCSSCKRWFKELKDSHEKGKSPSWHKNCNSSQWSEDHWEVAKYFMSALGSNLSTVKDAKSTDLSSLLNVLEWMKDTAFLGKTRVNVDLVRKLRSKVRNTWAHAPQQELTDEEKKEDFSITADFLNDINKVYPNAENVKCLEYLEHLKTKGITRNVAECELPSLLLQRQLLDDIKEEIKNMKVELSSDKSAIEEHRQQLLDLERALNERSQRKCSLESFKENIDKQFKQFGQELESFRGIPDDIHEIRESIGQIRDDLAKMNKPQKVEPVPTSCLPDKLINFAGREAEIEKVIDLLQSGEKAVVSLHGGPGFGKTAIAIQVSHKLSEEHNIPVLFSQLTTATNEDKMIRQLCLDVGLNYEGDPKPPLILWLRNIVGKIIWIMDDIDNLLEDKTSFFEFVRLLRKNSRQHFQIITTSRMSCEIPELQTDAVRVDEMEEVTCMELLKKQCSEQNDKFLQKLAKLCGYVPLAICIAGSLVEYYEDSDELLHDLEKQPMETLQRPKSNQFVKRAINLSYEKCLKEEKETLFRLSVFEGSFSEEAATFVINKNKSDTRRILTELVRRSLIKQTTQHRYSIHLLIKHFLKDKRESGNDERVLAAAKRAEVLMVEYYLEFGHKRTMKSYSKNGYKDNREALKREASNILNVLKICSQQEDLTSSDVSDCLARSKIYNTSAKFFSLLLRTIIPRSVVDEFLQQCAKIAKTRNEVAFKISFDCLLADQERRKSIGRSNEYFFAKTEEIKKEFETHEDLKEEKTLCAHYYYLCWRYTFRKAVISKKMKLSLQTEARKQMEKSLEIRQTLPETPERKADTIFTLLHLGNTCKGISTSKHHMGQKEESKISSNQAIHYYREAIQLSQDNLGDHELTSSCYKNLGDLLLKINEHGLAVKEYANAKQMRKNLGLDASEGHVLLLNNLGICLTKLDRVNEALEVLEEADDMAEKLTETNKPNVCKIKVSLSLAECLKQSGRANKALEVLEKARDTAERLAENDEPSNYKTKVFTSLAIIYHVLENYSEAVRYVKVVFSEFSPDYIKRIIKKHEYKKLMEISQIAENN